MRNLRSVAIVVGVLAATIGVGTAYASGESTPFAFPAGSFAINPQTCLFLHAEQDRGLGSTWLEGRVVFAFEDRRHDVKMACNTKRQTRVIRCFATPIPTVAERVDHKGGWADEKGAAAAVAAVQTIQTCVLKAGGLAP